MNDLPSRMRDIWNTTATRNAHLGKDGEKEFLYQRYKRLVTDMIDVTDRRIIDFGIGGGLLGKYLFENFRINKYIGYDLSDRSLQVAKENLKEYSNKELIKLEKHVFNFKEKNPDIIVCLACIIHFPTEIYLNNFLKTCNESDAKWLVLEIRDLGKGNKFFSVPYLSVKNTLLACITSEKYVSSLLTNYIMVNKTEWQNAPTNCQVLWYIKK